MTIQRGGRNGIRDGLDSQVCFKRTISHVQVHGTSLRRLYVTVLPIFEPRPDFLEPRHYRICRFQYSLSFISTRMSRIGVRCSK
jgi:hypothetical protein